MTLRERTEEVRHVEFRASEDADGQTLEGYAAVFNTWTDIRDAAGVYREQIAPGAFKRSLGQRTPVLQFDHGTGFLGSLPIGTPTVLREDRNGLFVRARLYDNWAVQPVRDAIAGGGIKGMSFRFRVIDDEWGSDDGGDTRTIKDVELLELGPVVFPAYETTSVAVRSLVSVLDNETRTALAQELVDALRDDDATATDTEDHGTTSVAEVPAEDDSPDEPPVASHETPRNRIVAALTRAGRSTPTETETSDVDQ